jgi:hypothetical protein
MKEAVSEVNLDVIASEAKQSQIIGNEQIASVVPPSQ